MGKFIDMTGWVMSKHGVPDSRLTVIKRADDHITLSGDKITMWVVQCSCGSESFECQGCAIRSGHTLSCGCLNMEISLVVNKKFNIYDLTGEYGVGFTSNTNREFYFDLEDYDKIKDICWCEFLVQGRYATLRGYKDKKPILMHQLLGFKNYDHENRNELDNRKSNLRYCTEQENHRNRSLSRNNTSGFTGVTWDTKLQQWRASITIDEKTIHLGSFINKNNAVKARLKAEKRYFKEFAPQRHLFEQYGITLQNDCEEMA